MEREGEGGRGMKGGREITERDIEGKRRASIPLLTNGAGVYAIVYPSATEQSECGGQPEFMLTTIIRLTFMISMQTCI